MPAHRSRTSGWRRCLQQVHERRGALDIAVVRDPEHDNGDSRHLIWRVRLVALTKEEILVERPTTLGQVIQLDPGIELVAILAVGQNRWMFSTSNLGLTQHGGRDHRAITAMRLAMPQHVERCQRRNYYRIETATLNLPEVEVWPLLDPKSVIVAERAVELQGNLERGGARGPTLLNIGGGGVGLRVRPQDAQALTRHKLFWLRFSLPPELSTPICATGKLAHTNVDSTQHTYAGMAFDFSFNPGHQRFVVEQICRYITAMQRRAQLRQSA
ncbi:MAG: PilZ domain-containing protein [Planctomycetota bacterium]